MPKIRAAKEAQKIESYDAIDRFAQEWTRERPDLDFAYLATLGRILRLSAHLRETMDQWLEPFGITWEMFDLLASLQRSGAESGLRPTDLYEACMLSSGATTNRIDRAEKLNYAARRPDAQDGRSTRIALTKRGAALTRRAMTRHSGCAREIAGRLSTKEQEQLARLLRKLLTSFEGEKGAGKKSQRSATQPIQFRSSPRKRGSRVVSLDSRLRGNERGLGSSQTK
jgi:DNA-binding MarR family transcriptional regulator